MAVFTVGQMIRLAAPFDKVLPGTYKVLSVVTKAGQTTQVQLDLPGYEDQGGSSFDAKFLLP